MTETDFSWLDFHCFEADTTRVFFVEPDRSGALDDIEGFMMARIDGFGLQGGRDLNLSLNGRPLPRFDPGAFRARDVWLNHLPAGALKKGENRLTLHQGKAGAARFARVVVHWRQRK